MSRRREVILFCAIVLVSLGAAMSLALRGQSAIPHPKSDGWTKLLACTIDKHYLEMLYSIAFTPDIKAMNGKPITLDGFVLPLESTEKFTHFLLSSRSPSCPYCPPGAPNEIVEIFSDTPITWTDRLVTLHGILKLMPPKNDTGIFFQMHDAEIVEANASTRQASVPPHAKARDAFLFTEWRGPNFADGHSVNLQAWSGKPRLIAFWRSDCLPCLKERASLARIARQNPGLPLLLVLLEDIDHARKALAVMPPNIHVLVPEAEGREILSAFGNDKTLALPYSTMLDARGEPCGKRYGILELDMVNQWRKQCSRTH